MRLRKRPDAVDETDIGIDGEWTPRDDKANQSAPIQDLLPLCMSLEDLSKFGYPLKPDEVIVPTSEPLSSEAIEEDTNSLDDLETPFVPPEDPDREVQETPQESQSNEDESSQTEDTKAVKQDCARCRKPFELKFPLEPYDLEACQYHHGILRVTQLEGNLLLNVHFW